MRSVFIVDWDHDDRYADMFTRHGYTTASGVPKDVSEYLDYDLICFTGGADLSPIMYGQKNTGQSRCDEARDRYELSILRQFLKRGPTIPMVGICRGGQFLNVAHDGKMIQHITGHHMGVHDIKVLGSVFPVLGDHHQAMVPSKAAKVLARAEDGVAEILWYPPTGEWKNFSLAFQAHPEWGHDETEKLFFRLVDELLFDGEENKVGAEIIQFPIIPRPIPREGVKGGDV